MVQINRFGEALSSIRLEGSKDVVKNGLSTEFLKALVEGGIKTYGVRYGMNSMSVFVGRDSSKKALAIAKKCASLFGYNNGVSVKNNLGMLKLDFTGDAYSIPMAIGPITFALYDTGIKVIEVVSEDTENLVFVHYPDLKKAEDILKEIYLR